MTSELLFMRRIFRFIGFSSRTRDVPAMAGIWNKSATMTPFQASCPVKRLLNDSFLLSSMLKSHRGVGLWASVGGDRLGVAIAHGGRAA
jgi:hypothetical protein